MEKISSHPTESLDLKETNSHGLHSKACQNRNFRIQCLEGPLKAGFFPLGIMYKLILNGFKTRNPNRISWIIVRVTGYTVYNVVVQFYPSFKFYFPLFQTRYHTLPVQIKEKKIKPRKIESQHYYNWIQVLETWAFFLIIMCLQNGSSLAHSHYSTDL